MKNKKVKILATEMPYTPEECPFSYKEMSSRGQLENICSFSHKVCADAFFYCTKLTPIIMPDFFIICAKNRKDAYTEYFKDSMCASKTKQHKEKIKYAEFCEELEKGYGQSKFEEIARLYEDKNGVIWYDTNFKSRDK